jgi:hypothetical protein
MQSWRNNKDSCWYIASSHYASLGLSSFRGNILQLPFEEVSFYSIEGIVFLFSITVVTDVQSAIDIVAIVLLRISYLHKSYFTTPCQFKLTIYGRKLLVEWLWLYSPTWRI